MIFSRNSLVCSNCKHHSHTHVLVEDSTRGYAIFAENMLETAENIQVNN
ncbi:MAG: hypothetical protein E7525_05190 [Ruminococcaceae bacterium]|nr:hypothetical protein [Oscillospiraceae bacterium]